MIRNSISTSDKKTNILKQLQHTFKEEIFDINIKQQSCTQNTPPQINRKLILINIQKTTLSTTTTNWSIDGKIETFLFKTNKITKKAYFPTKHSQKHYHRQ